MTWPVSRAFVSRYRVDDLVPPPGEWSRLRAVFIGESPHKDEVAPEDPRERSPFRGMAGREFWTEVAKYLKAPGMTRPVPPRAELERICTELGMALMNAIQYPLDPKIALHYGEGCSPAEQLGFEKATGPRGYKAIAKKGGPGNAVDAAIRDLVQRLSKLQSARAQLVCLGNDSCWFVERAIAGLPAEAALLSQPVLTIPHPASWWRNAANRTRASETLRTLLARVR